MALAPSLLTQYALVPRPKAADALVPAVGPPGATLEALPTPGPGLHNPRSEFGYLFAQLQSQANTGPGTIAGPWEAKITITDHPPPGGGTVDLAFTQVRTLGSGQRGLILNRKASDTDPHGIGFRVDNTPAWGMGIDQATDVYGINADYVPVFSHVIGGDVFRFSHRPKGSGGCQWIFGNTAVSGVGSPAIDVSGQQTAGCIVADPALGGFELRVNNATQPMIQLTQQGAHRRAVIGFGTVLQAGMDVAAGNLKQWSLYDPVNVFAAAGHQHKVSVRVGATEGAQGIADGWGVGLNCSDPTGLLEVRGTTAVSREDKPQTFFVGATGSGARTNRSIVLEKIRTAVTVQNFVWVMGALDETNSTAATPKGQSDFTLGFGLRHDNTNGHICTFPSGTNQAIGNLMSFGNSQLSFFGVAVASRQTGGVATAGGTYGATEQTMLQKAYDALRTYGLLT